MIQRNQKHGNRLTPSASVSSRSVVNPSSNSPAARRPQDEVADSLEMPAHLAEHPTLNEQYVSPADISRMVMKQYCGWWDDIPSHWSPARFDQQAAAICELAGGVDAVIARARELVESDSTMASHLVDWAYYAEPANQEAAQAVLDIYRTRIINDAGNTQEVLMYLDHMTDVQLRLDRATDLGHRTDRLIS